MRRTCAGIQNRIKGDVEVHGDRLEYCWEEKRRRNSLPRILLVHKSHESISLSVQRGLDQKVGAVIGAWNLFAK